MDASLNEAVVSKNDINRPNTNTKGLAVRKSFLMAQKERKGAK
jgi:hypothetical protein